MSGTCPGLGRDAGQFLGTQSYYGALVMSEKQAHYRHSGQFLEHGVQAMFETHPDLDREVAYFLCISRTRFVGHVPDAVGTQPDFESSRGSF
ncbi:Hypothetical predicted protein [Olea europaea subsp. europaea]|uniref:Uncharacterized protein n=1 Tax=Olea europaea subsp. europaea TaxID=158383 RepID=A0A8S0T5L3_OLEEU|nr:Hypothetical predicted protein [Olea europaea subsp. europaea]